MALPLVGWKEWAWLPDLGIGPIKAKIDTGARTSALHAHEIEIVDEQVRFGVHTIQHRDDFSIRASADLVEMRDVRDSGGRATTRPVIKTPLEVCGQRFPVEVTLVSRDDMTFRMLLGRSSLAGRFAVDCAAEYLGGVPEATRNWSAS